MAEKKNSVIKILFTTILLKRSSIIIVKGYKTIIIILYAIPISKFYKIFKNVLILI